MTLVIPWLDQSQVSWRNLEDVLVDVDHVVGDPALSFFEVRHLRPPA